MIEGVTLCIAFSIIEIWASGSLVPGSLDLGLELGTTVCYACYISQSLLLYMCLYTQPCRLADICLPNCLDLSQ